MKCKKCGSNHTVKAGTYPNRKGRYQRWLCKKCGSIMKGKQIEKWMI